MLLLHIAEVATGGISQVSGSAIIDQMFLTDARLEKRADQGSDFQSLGKKRSLKYCMPHYPFGMACSESMGGRHVPTSRRQSADCSVYRQGILRIWEWYLISPPNHYTGCTTSITKRYIR